MKTGRGGSKTFTVSWKPDEMDSTARGMYGYLEGDMACVNIWSNLTMVKIRAGLSLRTPARMNDRDKLRVNRYMSFRSNLATLYHGTPPGRQGVRLPPVASFRSEPIPQAPAAKPSPARGSCR